MYFPDLSIYSYDQNAELRVVRNIGWLSAAHTFQTGTVPFEVLYKLTALAMTRPVRPTRASHACEFCGGVQYIGLGGREVSLGAAELWVPSVDEKCTHFAAPDLIVHYLLAHGYRPPAEYIKSVMAVDLTSWKPNPEYPKILRGLVPSEHAA
jgi:hypothetical protein